MLSFYVITLNVILVVLKHQAEENIAGGHNISLFGITRTGSMGLISAALTAPQTKGKDTIFYQYQAN